MDQVTISYNCLSVNSIRGCSLLIRPGTDGIIGIPDEDGKIKDMLLDMKRDKTMKHQTLYLKILGVLYGTISTIGTDVRVTSSGSIMNLDPGEQRNAVGIEFGILAEITEDVHQTIS